MSEFETGNPIEMTDGFCAFEDDEILGMDEMMLGAYAPWIPDKHPRGPNGKFIEAPDLINSTTKNGASDITSLANGSKFIDHVSLHTTPNKNLFLLNVRLKVDNHFANVGVYVAKNALAIQTIQNVLKRFDAGDAIRGIGYIGIKKFSNAKFYNPYRVISKLIRGQIRGPIPGI